MRRHSLIDLSFAHQASWAATARYREALEHTRERIRNLSCQEHAVVLEDARGWRTALLGLASNAGLPLHDHPSTRGVLFLLEGTVNIHQYDVIERSESANVALLADRGNKTLSQREPVLFGRRVRNLHAIANHGSPAVLFSIRQRLAEAVRPSLYAILPTTGSGPGNLLPAMAFPAQGATTID